jgi:hypothetical protein
MPAAIDQLTYFETSAWNRLADRVDRQALANQMRMQRITVVTGVYAAGEILSTPDKSRRGDLCRLVAHTCDGDRPLLDQPEYLLRYTAEAWREGRGDFLARESPGAVRLRSLLESPEDIDENDRGEVIHWIRQGAHADHEAIFADLRDVGPRVGPPFCSPEVLEMHEFNQLLVEKVPAVSELGLGVNDVLELARVSDVWKAYRAMVAYTIDAAIDRMPASRPSPSGGRPEARPGGPDLGQAVYLGACSRFILRDRWLQDALTQIAEAAGLTRQVVATEEFFGSLTRAAG